MKFFKILLTSILFLIFFSSTASAQSDTTVLKHILVKTAKLYTNYPTEKVYLHFDKPYYAVGDTIWFKAYLTVDNHQLSPLSKIINVNILGPRDSLIQTLRLNVKNGLAWGSFVLSQFNYKKGNYRVVAYTNWMNNFDAAYFFNKDITIGDAVNNAVSTQVYLKSTDGGKGPKITAGIYFKDDDGKPYGDKRVNWTVEKDFETIIKPKEPLQTDKNGFVNINFTNSKNYSLDSATLITVIDNINKKKVTSMFPLKSVSKPNDIQFFPEGGQLIIGLRSKVAFKAITPIGLGIDVKGTITDNTNNIVAEFESSHLGMGVFAFTPEQGKTYTAKVSFADGTTATPDLPKMETGGIAIGLENSDPSVLRLKIQADTSFLQAYKGQTFFILAKSSGIICFAAKTKLESQVYSAAIPKNKFPTGIVQVTLFSEDGEPLSERIAFIQNNDLLNLSISGDHSSYTTRQKVKLNIAAKNGQQPVEGSFSIAVLDDSKVPFDENAEITILTNLLLTSDIKGYIEKPNYYFNHPDEKTAADLDVLLQTQGYRRFSYNGIMNDKYPPITYMPEMGINVKGTLRAQSGIPVRGGNVRLTIPDKNFSADAVTDENGRFGFSNLVFPDSTKIHLSARNNVRSNDLVLTIDNDGIQRIPVNLNTQDEILNIDSTLSAYLKNSKIEYNNTNVLKEVVIKDTRIEKTVSHKDYSALASLASEPDHVISGKLLQGCAAPLDCIRSLAPGVTFDNNNFYVARDYGQGKRIPMAIFLRGLPVDVNVLVTLDPNAIESVEIFYTDELGLVNSAYGTDGVLVVNMKKVETTKISYQDLKSLIPQQNELTFTPLGYAPVRTFYLPRYSGPRESQPNRTDTRSTIYWNPNVITDKTGAASVEYFNADGKGTYRAIIEGIDKDGNLGRQVFHYTVN
jgi:hypothetical protein